MGKERVGRFKSERARQEFIRVHDELMDEYWPSARDFVQVETSFGRTRVQHNGSGDGVPLVLLTGAGGTPLGFRPVIRQLSAVHPVLSLETIGEPGHDLQDKPVLSGADLATWLVEVLDALGVERAHLVGCSYGALISVHTALHAPERVASATLIDPPALERLGWRAIRWLLLGAVFTPMPRPIRAWAARWLPNGTLLEDWVPRLFPKMVRYRRVLPDAVVLTDEQLAALAVPTLFLFGERSVLHDAAAARARVAAFPNITGAVVVPGAGHVVHIDDPERTVGLVLDFVGSRVGRPGDSTVGTHDD
ncbi:alpha/beta fold hydrolase [Crossiella cryophila]|uniref:Pimeloyl-ACP methyl ester carboxylesterase n=1 Tax=Crossiella cryophila TaxID=43355 RepID=A0A7W7CDX6_9PSEU|nr:alpha/beta hydrolase [Crossiella cryophila]MBB4679247.1 pimeloyl-ACP methyl ester carboxylesterase [Crossiella cryophila]